MKLYPMRESTNISVNEKSALPYSIHFTLRPQASFPIGYIQVVIPFLRMTVSKLF